MTTEQIMAGLCRLYGPSEGMRVYMTIMPGILADFQKMLRAAPVGHTLQETYKLEDGRAALILQGYRSGNGQMQVDMHLQ